MATLINDQSSQPLHPSHLGCCHNAAVSLPRPAPGAAQLSQPAAAVEMPHEAVQRAALEVAEEEGAVAEHNLNIFA